MRQINELWEPLERLGSLFNINTKTDFLVNSMPKTHQRVVFPCHSIFQVGIKCLETAAYGAYKRIEILSTSLIDVTDNNEESSGQPKVRDAEIDLSTLAIDLSDLQSTPKSYRDEATIYYEAAQKYTQAILALVDARKE